MNVSHSLLEHLLDEGLGCAYLVLGLRHVLVNCPYFMQLTLMPFGRTFKTRSLPGITTPGTSSVLVTGLVLLLGTSWYWFERVFHLW